MGNTASCSCISNSVTVKMGVLKKSGKCNKTAMLLDTSGKIREMKLPMKSWELMIEEIGHVITPVDELHRTRRISALRGDEELVAGKVYLLVPAIRARSKASEFEMAMAEQWVSGKESGQKKKPSGNMGKVSPVSTLRERREGENEDSIFTPHLVCRSLGNQPRWNPVLDPIFESS